MSTICSIYLNLYLAFRHFMATTIDARDLNPIDIDRKDSMTDDIKEDSSREYFYLNASKEYIEVRSR